MLFWSLFWLLDNNTRYQVDSSSSIICLWNLSLDDISTTIIMEHSRIQDCFTSVRDSGQYFAIWIVVAFETLLYPWSVDSPFMSFVIVPLPLSMFDSSCCSSSQLPLFVIICYSPAPLPVVLLLFDSNYCSFPHPSCLCTKIKPPSTLQPLFPYWTKPWQCLCSDLHYRLWLDLLPCLTLYLTVFNLVC